MKKLFLVVPVAFFLLATASFGQQIKVTGDVYLKKYQKKNNPSNLKNLIPTSVEYVVNIKIKNSKSKAIPFDQVMIIFAPKEGSRLTYFSKQFELPEEQNGKLTDGDIERMASERGIKMELSANDEIKLDFTTGAYTANLVRDAGNVPIKVLVYLLNDDKPSAHPFYAMLTTDLNRLPYFVDKSGGTQKGMKLNFYDIYYNE